MIVDINAKNPQPRLIRRVVGVLEEGGLIGYPTDTIYGVGCDLFNPESIRKIHRLKKLEGKKPLSFICSDLKDISRYAYVSNYAYKMMKRLLPGAYTFVLKATKLVPKIAMTKQNTVGIRIPDNKICLALVKELGHPIISTSVYKPDEGLYNDPAEIEERFGKQLDLVIDGGVIVAEHSSIIDLTDDSPKVIRKGKGNVSLFQ
ncbi:MAG: threonylcarbamoyl-AMP synthase [Deltaproteobacteria bacterium CG_4_8_14_3_um_filter_45_9]|nr:MAG: threonylcarbamoyl-AMP synthase [Deltaproteobacteria bacterium CG03_land_8_20_14_0_80_45_14]PIX26535.1 MAG: threonylcarbamoyl-AMP synthase [Deltaproteobacteria bacterium CG_4_8_14_3_um_filter_45_9]